MEDLVWVPGMNRNAIFRSIEVSDFLLERDNLEQYSYCCKELYCVRKRTKRLSVYIRPPRFLHRVMCNPARSISLEVVTRKHSRHSTVVGMSRG